MQISRFVTPQAATCPTVFITADAVLRQCIQLQRGEVLLLPAAAGGVGLAGMQVWFLPCRVITELVMALVEFTHRVPKRMRVSNYYHGTGN